MIAGDNLLSFDVSEFVDAFRSAASPMIATYDVGSVDRASSYGVVDVADGEVVDFAEKPTNPTSSLVSIACYGFPAETLPSLSTYLEEEQPRRAGLVRPVALRARVDPGVSVRGGLVRHRYAGVLPRRGRLAPTGETRVAESATVERTTLGENVHVMAGAEVTDSHLSRSVIFPDATIQDCEVRSSIIDRKTALDGLEFNGALVGAHADRQRRMNGLAHLSGKRIVVTGGAGFVGSHLTERLVERTEVVVADDLSNGRREWVPDGATFVHTDLTDPEDAADVITADTDVVCHLAASKSVDTDRPREQFESNAAMTHNVLERMRAVDVPRSSLRRRRPSTARLPADAGRLRAARADQRRREQARRRGPALGVRELPRSDRTHRPVRERGGPTASGP